MVCSKILNSTEEEHPAKKIKIEPLGMIQVKEEINETSKIKSERWCIRCKQFLDTAPLYNGHPNHSTEEFIALTDEKLSLFTGTESVHENDEIPTHKITHFSVYDDKGHLCSFDSGLIEKNVPLFFSGYVKPIYEEDPRPNDGIPGHDFGPINEWWTAGYDGGEKLPMGFTTEYANYYLMDPSPEYEPLFNKIKEKISISKIVIEFLLDKAWENPNYEDLIQQVESSGHYRNVEDTLLQNAQFICDQVLNYDSAYVENDEKPLISLPCMRSLVKIAGVTFQKRKQIRKTESKLMKTKKGPLWTKAVTTKLVHDVFEHFFPDQIDSKGENKGPKKKRCGVCESCQSPDCGECVHCKDMLKFGGSGKSKQACKNRRCPNMAILDAELSDNEEETESKEDSKKGKFKLCSKRILHRVKWGEKSEIKYRGNECYSSADVGDICVKPGDCVMLRSENPNEPLCIVKIVYMYDMLPQRFMFHGHLFCRGTDSILGETADPRELFFIDDCDDLPLGSIVRKAEVEYRKIPGNWSELGGTLNLDEPLEDDGKSFFYNKRLDENRFVDLDFEPESWTDECDSCRRKLELKKYETPSFEGNYVEWQNEKYRVSSGVFLQPDSYNFLNVMEIEPTESKETNMEEILYPEYYRKKSDNIKGSNNDTPEPFVIGMIEEIIKQKNDIKVKVKMFFRPENTRSSVFSSHVKDLNYLYYSDEEATISFEKVAGKCYLAFGDNFESPSDWSKKGPSRYYFTESYDPKTHQYDEVPMKYRKLGTLGKGKGGKGKRKNKENEMPELPPEWVTVDQPLRCMDVFAGCGGLSEGLHQSGVVESKWAIEIELAAANAYRLNNPNCKVFSEDCNYLLKLVLNGEGHEKGLPAKGDVEMLVGGPPCQGFSGMNRFNAGQYSIFKNSLVVSYLSYCEYYRPKYFILENVRNFVSFKRSIVLKLTLRCLLAMGYQVTFGVLQAGHYGVPQTRRRLIIMAAAPGYVLPKYPEPLHVFNKRGCQLSFAVDGCRYFNGCEWTESAPYRTICVRDAMSDLPDIKNGWNKSEMPYDSDAVSHFQKMMRGNEERVLVQDHICKEMSALVEARISHIPTYPGADWRDLPNKSVKLADGMSTYILRYPYSSKKQKKSDPPKGVCQCATGEQCDPTDKQFNTLIPWCLPHTADRHNHWAGLYGRLEWDGFFGTTITNPEPMGKQGRVLHPEQHRVVSVRECARSQGFPDKFKFYGNILDKHRQVGNAVPPPLGAALGKEFRNALVETLKKGE